MLYNNLREDEKHVGGRCRMTTRRTCIELLGCSDYDQRFSHPSWSCQWFLQMRIKPGLCIHALLFKKRQIAALNHKITSGPKEAPGSFNFFLESYMLEVIGTHPIQ
jgi:hypothetical protein